MKTVAKDWGSEESVEMHKMLFDPYKLYQTGALDKVLQGAISTKLERADSYFNTQVSDSPNHSIFIEVDVSHSYPDVASFTMKMDIVELSH